MILSLWFVSICIDLLKLEEIRVSAFILFSMSSSATKRFLRESGIFSIISEKATLIPTDVTGVNINFRKMSLVYFTVFS